MSFCEKCGSQYDESREHNFCARCGFDLRKTASAQKAIPEPSPIEPPPSINQSQPENKKPIAGIVVALVVGVIGLIWSFVALFHSLNGNPSNIQALLYQTFPTLQIKNLIGFSFALLGNAVLVIGALMAHLNHPQGAKVVRATCYSMIALTVLLAAITCFAVFGADAWPTLDAPTKGAMIGGLIGGIIGAVFQWGLILFLFRKCKSASNIVNQKSGDNSKTVIIAVSVIVLLVVLIACFSGQSNKQANATTETQQITQTTEPAVATPPPTPAAVAPAVQTEEELKFNSEKKLAEGGDATAQFNLGLRYSTQTTFFVVGSKDDVESAKWFSKAADQGFTNAQIEIGRAYYFGRGVVEDKNKAVNWFRKAAEQGSVQGELYVGICYKNGDGVPMNAEEAVKWLTQAANQNDATAQFELGCCYSEYKGIDYVKKNNVIAYKWLSLAKAQGKQGTIDGQYGSDDALEYVAFYLSPEQKAEAQKLAAQFISENANAQASQDVNLAANKLKKDRELAESGDAQAALRLGLCYKRGDGVPANADEAVKWLTQAANKNNATAQFELGCCYSEHKGIDYVKKNNVIAYKWLSLAKAQGKQGTIDGQYGSDALEYVAFYLSPEQKAEAQKLAAEFVPTK